MVATQVVQGVLEGFDVVYSPAITSYGSCPATLAESPGTCVSVHVNWLTREELEVSYKRLWCYSSCLGPSCLVRCIRDGVSSNKPLQLAKKERKRGRMVAKPKDVERDKENMQAYRSLSEFEDEQRNGETEADQTVQESSNPSNVSNRLQQVRFPIGKREQELREGADHRLLNTVYAYCHKGGCLTQDHPNTFGEPS
eukprot:scaffold30323_cov17-Tisochrysis_lutea.AAC.1